MNGQIPYSFDDDGVSPEYELKFGFLGSVLDSLFVRKTYAKGMRALLAGLKRQVEQP